MGSETGGEEKTVYRLEKQVSSGGHAPTQGPADTDALELAKGDARPPCPQSSAKPLSPQRPQGGECETE